MKPAVALKDHVYAGRMRRKGQIYSVGDGHVRVLEALGQIRIQPEKEVVKIPVPITVEPDMSEEPPKPKRRYRRRDMEAED